MMFLILIFLQIIALSFIAFSISKHQTQIFNRKFSDVANRTLWCIGYLLLCTTMYFAYYIWQLSVGICIWFGGLSLAALGVGLFITYYPKKIANWLKR